MGSLIQAVTRCCGDCSDAARRRERGSSGNTTILPIVRFQRWYSLNPYGSGTESSLAMVYKVREALEGGGGAPRK
jgi:hypothetical protein